MPAGAWDRPTIFPSQPSIRHDASARRFAYRSSEMRLRFEHTLFLIPKKCVNQFRRISSLEKSTEANHAAGPSSEPTDSPARTNSKQQRIRELNHVSIEDVFSKPGDVHLPLEWPRRWLVHAVPAGRIGLSIACIMPSQGAELDGPCHDDDLNTPQICFCMARCLHRAFFVKPR